MDRETIWEKYLTSKKLHWYLLSGAIMAVIYFFGYIFLFVIPASDSPVIGRYFLISSEEFSTMDILTFGWSCFILILLWVPFFVSLLPTLLGGNVTITTDNIIDIILAITPAIVGSTFAFVIIWKEQTVHYWNKKLNPNKEKQQNQLNELVGTNSRRLEQAQWAIKKQYFQEAKRIFITIRDSLNDFEENVESKNLRIQIRKQRRQLALEEKIRDMDDFVTHTYYEKTIIQINQLCSEKQYKRALRETWDLLLLLQDIETKHKKYNLPVPSQIEDQYKEVDQRYQELLENHPPEEK